MNQQLAELNEKYLGMAVDVFPFLSKNRVTILKKGFYTKKNANYRGISMILDRKQGFPKALLVGFYYVPKDMIIVPENLTITDAKRKLISDKLNKGFEMVLSFPSLMPYTFSVDSPEYKAAENAYNEYHQSLVK